MKRPTCLDLLAGTLLGSSVAVVSLCWSATIGCGAAQLTPEQAGQELDLACETLVAVLADHDTVKAAVVTRDVCQSRVTRQLVERALAQFDGQDAGADFLLERFPSDGGAQP